MKFPLKLLQCSIVFFLVLFAACKKREDSMPVVTRPVKLSHEAVILSFGFMKSDNSPYLLDDFYGAISGDTIRFVLPAETDVSNLKPAIEFRGKTITAAAGVAQNFTTPVHYTVTAEDSSQIIYTVIVKYRSTLFISSDDGTMHALDGQTGAEIWSVSNGEFNGGVPVVYKGKVYDCGYDGLYALDARNGAEKWKFADNNTTSGDFPPSPVVMNDTVYISMHDGFLYALDAENGDLFWKTRSQSGMGFSSNVTLNGDILYAGCSDSCLYALNAHDGNIIWKLKTTGGISANPLIANNNVFVTVDYNQYLLNGATGALLWKVPSNFQRSSPTFYNGIIYTGGGALSEGFDVNTGARVWEHYVSTNVFERSSPLIWKGRFYAGSVDGNIYAFDLASNQQLWSFQTHGMGIYSSPVIANGVLYIGTPGQTIFAVDANTGTMIWARGTGGSIFGSGCVSDENGIKYYPGISGEQN
jgi:outer membrane protein assembly factor BamB